MMQIRCNLTQCLGVLGFVALFLFLVRLWTHRRRVSVRGKVVVITGASSGVGEACAHAFYNAGAKVILCARRVSELQRVKKDLLATKTKYTTMNPEVLPLDLMDLESLPEKAEKAIRFHGHVDILINNGGISYRGNIMETDLDVHEKVLQVNYLGQVVLTRAILPSMLSTGYGHVVGVSSVQGKIAIPFRSAYAASKHAMQAFMDCLRSELAYRNIHVSVISPGYISTNLSKNAVTGDGSVYGVMDTTTASGMPPEDVARHILHAVRYQEEEVILAPKHHVLMVMLRNVFPGLFFSLMKKRAKKIYQAAARTANKDE